MLTGKEIYESGMLSNVDESLIQMQGIDMRVQSIQRILPNTMGIIPKEGKTKLPTYQTIEPMSFMNKESGERILGWQLKAGVYDVTFMEGIELDDKHAARPITRSSLNRCGSRIHSGLFDAGFKTTNIGSMLYVDIPIMIAVGAPLAQITIYESNEVDRMYDGQWQGDNQRQQ